MGYDDRNRPAELAGGSLIRRAFNGSAIGFVAGIVLGVLVSAGFLLVRVLPMKARIVPADVPLLSPLGGGDQWVLWSDLHFRIEADGGNKFDFRIPRGFIASLATTPKDAQGVYAPSGRYLSAAILHDYLYWIQACPRDAADRIFVQALKDAPVVANADPNVFYASLQKSGGRIWNGYTKEKVQGLVRIVPVKLLDKEVPGWMQTSSWTLVQLNLRNEGVTESPVEDLEAIGKLCEEAAREIKPSGSWRMNLSGQ